MPRPTYHWNKPRKFHPISLMENDRGIWKHDPATVHVPHEHTVECWTLVEGDEGNG